VDKMNATNNVPNDPRLRDEIKCLLGVYKDVEKYLDIRQKGSEDILGYVYIMITDLGLGDRNESNEKDVINSVAENDEEPASEKDIKEPRVTVGIREAQKIHHQVNILGPLERRKP
jgi:hypothetical protein